MTEADLRILLEKSITLHKANYSTLWWTKERLVALGKAHGEIDRALEETSQHLRQCLEMGVA